MGRTAPVFFVRASPEGSPDGFQRVDITKSVTYLCYDDHESQPDKLTIKLNNYNYKAYGQNIFAKGTSLEVTWGYADGTMSAPRRCTVTKLKINGHELVVEAKGGEHLFNLRREMKTYTQVKRSDVAKQIAQANGFAASTTFIDDTTVVLPQVTQGAMTSAALLRDMARREGFEWWIDYQGFHFRKRDLGAKPRRSFIYFLDPGQGDILTPPVVDNDIDAKPGAIVAKGIDPKTKQPIAAKVDNTTDTGRGGLAGILDIFGSGPNGASGTPTTTQGSKVVNQQTGALTPKLGQDAVLPTTAKTAAEAQNLVNGAFSKSQLSAIKMSFTAIGDPLMEAKCLITMSGLEDLSGNYYVTELKHEVVPNSGYKMVVKCRRDGSSATPPNPIKSSAAVDNQQGPTAGTNGTQLQPVKTVNPSTGAAAVVFKPLGTPPKGS